MTVVRGLLRPPSRFHLEYSVLLLGLSFYIACASIHHPFPGGHHAKSKSHTFKSLMDEVSLFGIEKF